MKTLLYKKNKIGRSLDLPFKDFWETISQNALTLLTKPVKFNELEYVCFALTRHKTPGFSKWVLKQILLLNESNQIKIDYSYFFNALHIFDHIVLD